MNTATGEKSGDVLIHTLEGCHLHAYKCPSSVWTIGWGHTAGVYEGEDNLTFTYNVGTGNLARSKLLRKVKANAKDPSIRGEFSRWVYGGGKRHPGLVRRRKMEADLYFS